jgi:hypothetical protein
VFFFRFVDYALGEYFSGDVAAILRLSLTGGGLLGVLYFLPGGLWQFVQRQRDRYLRTIAARRGIHVPSLVADKRVDEAIDDDHPDDETALIRGALASESP